jgi:hypothetical protein
VLADLNYLAVGAAAVAALVVTFIYYMAFGTLLEALDSPAAEGGTPPAWLLPVELLRSLVVAAVVAGLAVTAGIAGWTGALLLGVALWVAFPLVLLLGSVAHEKVPAPVAAIHAGDWLLKLVIISAIVGLWR